MTHEQVLHPELSTRRPHLSHCGPEREPRPVSCPTLRSVVLIEVPEVRRKVRAARRPSAAATSRLRAHPPANSRGRGRRRLRREIRIAGSILSAVLPMLLALALVRGGPATGSGSEALEQGVIATVRPPTISLSIEAPGVRIHAEPKSPVVFPGYLLPDDGGEESAHAGG